MFGCRKLLWELNWSGNSISQMEKKWSSIPILLFGCECNLCLESEGSTQFQFLFGCMNLGIGCFVEFGQYKTWLNYEKNCMCIFEY